MFAVTDTEARADTGTIVRPLMPLVCGVSGTAVIQRSSSIEAESVAYESSSAPTAAPR